MSIIGLGETPKETGFRRFYGVTSLRRRRVAPELKAAELLSGLVR